MNHPGRSGAGPGTNGSDGIERLRRAAKVLDDSITIPGTKATVGIDSIIGLVPGLGDAVGLVFSGAILWQAFRMGASKRLLIRMLFNSALDALLGAVPLVGDWHDVVWKANVKNVALLERHLADPKGVAQASGWFLAGLMVALLGTAVGALLLALWMVQQIALALPF